MTNAPLDSNKTDKPLHNAHHYTLHIITRCTSLHTAHHYTLHISYAYCSIPHFESMEIPENIASYSHATQLLFINTPHPSLTLCHYIKHDRPFGQDTLTMCKQRAKCSSSLTHNSYINKRENVRTRTTSVASEEEYI